MSRPRPGLALLAACLGVAVTGCATVCPECEARIETPPEITDLVGSGPVDVHGENLYSPGQKLHKALRQSESLQAFLACQGEPDRAEVVAEPGSAPRIVLEYRRRGVERGTVEIAPSAGGWYYAASPIDPRGTLPESGRPAPSEPVPPPKPEPPPRPAPPPLEEEPEPVAGEPECETPEPTPRQRDECPIAPWESDCQALCQCEPPCECDFEWCEGY